MDYFSYQGNTAKCAWQYLHVCHVSGTWCSLLHISTGDSSNTRHWAFENTPSAVATNSGLSKYNKFSLSSNMPSKFKTKHIHVVFVLIAETPPIFFSTRKIYGKKLKLYFGDIFFSSKNTLSQIRTVSAWMTLPGLNTSPRGVTSKISTSNLQREALTP